MTNRFPVHCIVVLLALSGAGGCMPTGGPLQHVAIGFGNVASFLDGDRSDHSQFNPNFDNNTGEMLLYVNGFLNNDADADNTVAQLRQLMKDSNANVTANNLYRVENRTHGFLADLTQSIFLECGAIDLPAQEMARQIKAMAAYLRQKNFTCPTIHIVAHSQGCAIADRAFLLLDRETLAMIDYHTNGAETLYPEDLRLRLVENNVNLADPIPWITHAFNPLKCFGLFYLFSRHQQTTFENWYVNPHAFTPNYLELNDAANLRKHCQRGQQHG
jgi:hypothetical protein